MNYKINDERVLFSPLGDEAVVFDRESNEYITLNETMYKIFQSIENNEDVEAIQAKLIKEYNIEAEPCRNSIDRSIAQLLERSFILAC